MEKGRFQKALEVVEALTEEERESLLEVVRKRSIEERRNRIAGSIKEARAEYKSGKIKGGSVDDLMRELRK